MRSVRHRLLFLPGKNELPKTTSSPGANRLVCHRNASLFVSNISTEHFIGLARFGRVSRRAWRGFRWQNFTHPVAARQASVCAIFLRSNVFSMPEFLGGGDFDSRCNYVTWRRSVIKACRFFENFGAANTLRRSLKPERVVGWNQWTAAIILVIATGHLHDCGRASSVFVIYTDLVQTLILSLALLL